MLVLARLVVLVRLVEVVAVVLAVLPCVAAAAGVELGVAASAECCARVWVWKPTTPARPATVALMTMGARFITFSGRSLVG